MFEEVIEFIIRDKDEQDSHVMLIDVPVLENFAKELIALKVNCVVEQYVSTVSCRLFDIAGDKPESVNLDGAVVYVSYTVTGDRLLPDIREMRVLDKDAGIELKATDNGWYNFYSTEPYTQRVRRFKGKGLVID